MLNDAAGGSVMNLTMSQTWDLIDDLAESLKRGPMHQTENKAPTVKADSVQNEPEEEAPEEGPVHITNLPEEITPVPDLIAEPVESNTVLTPEPSEDLEPEIDIVWYEEEPSWKLTIEPAEEEVPNTTDALPETDPVLITELTKTYHALTAELTEKITADLALVVEVSQLVPSVCMRITAPEDKVINEEVQDELEAGQRQEKPTMEHSLVMSQEKPAKNSLVLGWPIISAAKKRLGMGTSSRLLVFNGTILNFQNCKGADHSNMKKRPRYGPKEWKPGRRSKRARPDGPAAMVKESSPSRGYVKKKPPDQGRAELSPLPYVFFGQIKRAAEKKFDLKHPWDPYL
ncbi:unnamed protein product [Rhodiola kirilowii]